MNINILVTPDAGQVEGFLNIGREDFENIPDATCTIINASDTLEFFGSQFLGTIIKKMRHGCTIQLTGSDAEEYSKKLHLGMITMNDFSEATCNGRQSANELLTLTDAIKKVGLQVSYAAIVDNRYVIRALRP